MKTVSREALNYIVNLSNGSLRQAISYLDKVKDYDTNITVEAVTSCLGVYSYDTMFDLTNARLDGDSIKLINIIDDIYLKGSDLKLFINSYLDFILEVNKYVLLKDIRATKLPLNVKDKLDYLVNFDNPERFFGKFLDTILEIKQSIKGDNNAKTTIEVMLMKRGE